MHPRAVPRMPGWCDLPDNVLCRIADLLPPEDVVRLSLADHDTRGVVLEVLHAEALLLRGRPLGRQRVERLLRLEEGDFDRLLYRHGLVGRCRLYLTVPAPLPCGAMGDDPVTSSRGTCASARRLVPMDSVVDWLLEPQNLRCAKRALSRHVENLAHGDPAHVRLADLRYSPTLDRFAFCSTWARSTSRRALMSCGTGGPVHAWGGYVWAGAHVHVAVEEAGGELVLGPYAADRYPPECDFSPNPYAEQEALILVDKDSRFF